VSNHRYSKWWWQDWLNDAALRMCSVAARGLWMDVLAMAHGGVPAGHLTVNGKPASTKQIAAISRCTEREVDRLLAELEEAGVFSRTDAGVIFNRRMVRDAKLSEEGAVNAAKRKDRSPPTSHPTQAPIREPQEGPHKGGHYSIDQSHRSEASSLSKSESESPSLSDAGARGTAPREAKKVFNLIFPEDRPHQPEPPEPRRHATSGHALESTAKREPYGPVRSVSQQIEAVRQTSPEPQPPRILRPVEPVRSVEEQLAALNEKSA
jgi:hypothetical protein